MSLLVTLRTRPNVNCMRLLHAMDPTVFEAQKRMLFRENWKDRFF
jgi:hypothetical protein